MDMLFDLVQCPEIDGSLKGRTTGSARNELVRDLSTCFGLGRTRTRCFVVTKGVQVLRALVERHAKDRQDQDRSLIWA